MKRPLSYGDLSVEARIPLKDGKELHVGKGIPFVG